MNNKKITTTILAIFTLAVILSSISSFSFAKAEQQNFNETLDFTLNAPSVLPEGMSWDHKNKTLALNGINMVSSAGKAITLPHQSTIRFTGNNTIIKKNVTTYNDYVIQCNGDLIIEGSDTASLIFKGDDNESPSTFYSKGIWALGSIIHKKGNTTVYGGNSKSSSFGIDSYSLQIDGGSFTGIAGSVADTCAGIVLSGGQTKTKATDYNGQTLIFDNDKNSYVDSSGTPAAYVVFNTADNSTSTPLEDALNQNSESDINITLWKKLLQKNNITTYINTLSLPAPIADQEYSTILRGTGTGTLSWSIHEGTLPPGLTLSNDGIISGTATHGGTYSFTVKLNASSGDAFRDFTVQVIDYKPKFITSSLREGKVDDFYYERIYISGASVSKSIIDGSLPDGLVYEDGKIIGFPNTRGTYNFTVKAENPYGSVTQTFTIVIKSKEAIWWNAPRGVKASDITDTGVRISFAKVPGATRYYLYKSTSKNGPYEYAAWVNGKTNYFIYNKMKPDRNYYFKVSASMEEDGKRLFNPIEECNRVYLRSAKANTDKTNLNAPGGIKFESGVKISFAKVPGAERYALYVSSSKDGPYEYAAWVNGKTNYFTYYDIKPNRNYYFKITPGKTINGKMTFKPLNECNTLFVKGK